MIMRPKEFEVRAYEPGDEEGFIDVQLVAPALRNDVLVVSDKKLGDRVPRIRLENGTLELVQKHMVLIIDHERGTKRLVGKDFVQREMVPVPGLVPAADESDASDLSEAADAAAAEKAAAAAAAEKAKAAAAEKAAAAAAAEKPNKAK